MGSELSYVGLFDANGRQWAVPRCEEDTLPLREQSSPRTATNSGTVATVVAGGDTAIRQAAHYGSVAELRLRQAMAATD